MLIFHLHLMFVLKCCKHGLKEVEILVMCCETHLKKMQNFLNDWKVQDKNLEAFQVGVTNDSLVICYSMQHHK